MRPEERTRRPGTPPANDPAGATGRVRSGAAASPYATSPGPGPEARRSRRRYGVLSAAGRIAGTVLRTLLPVVLLGAVAAGIGYVRLSNGPIEITMLAEPVARGITAELDGLTAEIASTEIALGRRGLEFRLIDLRLRDATGQPVAVAPQATIDLSAAALLRGRLAPRHVVLVEPRMLLSVDDDGRVSLSVSQQAATRRRAPDGRAASADRAAPATEPTGSGAIAVGAAPVEQVAVESGRVDLARALADAARRARLQTGTASYLRSIGVRDAGLILDSGGRRTAWRLPSASIEFRHVEGRSSVTASANVISEGAGWTLSLEAIDDEAVDAVRLDVTLRDLVPKTLSRVHRAWSPLEGLKLPIGVSANAVLSRAGELKNWRALVAIGQGDVGLAAVSGLRAGMSGGTLDLRYDSSRHQIDLMPSSLNWAGGRLTLAGALAPASADRGESRWLFEVSGIDGELAPARTGAQPVKIQSLRVRGDIVADRGRVDIREAQVGVGGTVISASGRVGGSEASLAESVAIEGRLGAMSRATLEALWPRALSPALYDWVASEVEAVTITGGTFRIGGRARDGAPAAARPGGSAAFPAELSLEIGAARFRPAPGLPMVDVKRALYRLDGPGFEIAMPEATVDLGNGTGVDVRSARIAAADWWNPAAEADVSFRLQGGLAEAIQLIEQPLFGIGRLEVAAGVGVQGRVEGQFATKVALYAEPQRRMAAPIEGTARITDGRLRNVAGIGEIRGLGVAFELTDKAIAATGTMLVSGVAAKLTWQRILSGGAGEQPPLRVTAVLDTADRRQLGVDLSHVLQGDVGVEVTMGVPRAGEPKARVRVDLSAAELLLQSLAWAKPPGRTAALQFDLFDADKSSRFRTELRNLRLVGDGIAIEGSAALDAKGQLRQFELPQFSINTVTRLALRGELARDNVWKVTADGPTYDAQDIFRSMFSIGGAVTAKSFESKNAPGLDLEARVGNVIGFSDTALRGLSLKLSRRGGKLSALIARGSFDGGKMLEVGMQQATGQPRRMVALSDDAGQAFRLVGFYPNVQGGRMRLESNLDGRGAVERTGVLRVENFAILGDPIIGEVVESYSGPDGNQGVVRRRVGQRAVARQTLQFDRVTAPFAIGNGQFVLEDADLRGPLLGASLRGKVDFLRSTVDIGGTYVPLQALNAALSGIPGLGQLLTGPRGEGMWAMNFAIQGPMAGPEVIVHPFSMVAPGIFRDLFQITGQAPRVTAPPSAPVRRAVPPRSSASEPARRPSNAPKTRSPEITGGWTSETQKP